MNYQQALDFIHGLNRFGSRPGLERVAELLRRMGDPHKALQYVHVAGTNGKGSTCAMLAGALGQAGYRTGLYISPFVLEFRERIQVDGEMISPHELAACTERVKAVWDTFPDDESRPTEFETLFAVAVEHFRRRGCQVVVLEVGMGGRLDATNVIDAPLAAVITRIGLDHTEYLGDTLAQVAGEKCGILKAGAACVSYPRQEPEALAVIMERCAALGIGLHMGGSPQVLEQGVEGSRFVYGGEEYRIPLGGEHQIWNAVTALEAVKVLNVTGLKLPVQAVRAGLAGVRFPSRLEVLCKEPLVLLDGAHNPDGAQALGQVLAALGRPVHCVVGMMADKEVEDSLSRVLPHCVDALCCRPDNPRAMEAGALAGLASRHCAARAVDHPAQAFRQAAARCGPGEALVVFGSLFLAADIRQPILDWVAEAKK